MSPTPSRSRIAVTRVSEPGPLPKPPLGFGKHFTDHIFWADQDDAGGWRDFRIVPISSLGLDIASGALQYGLSVFEGLKAHEYSRDRSIQLFRPEQHAARMTISAERLCLPPFPEDALVEACKALTKVDERFVPEAGAGALYLRPVLFATEGYLGVRPASRNALAILASPVDAYFGAGHALRLWAERELFCAAPGGVGSVKTGGNYALSLMAARRAAGRGFDQVLWLDSQEHRFLGEAGTMNVFVHLKGRMVTPPLDGTILAGVTRHSVITLLGDLGVPVEERPIDLDELLAASEKGELLEIFGSGTAAVISPIGEVAWEQASVKPRGGELIAHAEVVHRPPPSGRGARSPWLDGANRDPGRAFGRRRVRNRPDELARGRYTRRLTPWT